MWVRPAAHVSKAIPHKEKTAQRTKKMYNKEVKKQLTMSLISDELGQASTKKKEFLGIMEKLIPWSQWVGIVQPHYYKGERGNKPYDLELMLRIFAKHDTEDGKNCISIAARCLHLRIYTLLAIE